MGVGKGTGGGLWLGERGVGVEQREQPMRSFDHRDLITIQLAAGGTSSSRDWS